MFAVAARWRAWGGLPWRLAPALCALAAPAAAAYAPAAVPAGVAVASGTDAGQVRSDGGTAVQVWVTNARRTKLLARQPDTAFLPQPLLSATLSVDAQRRYQEMVGFGAAMTDASAWLIHSRMSEAQRTVLMQELFGPAPGIGLGFMRLTIGASDFSQSHYSLDEAPGGAPDPDLQYFSIARYRPDLLPLLRQAQSINPHLRIMASPWSAPAWMKTSGSLIGGTLRPQDYDVFARYLWRYVDAMGAEGVPLYAVTVQNEPHFEPENYPGMRLDMPARVRLVGGFLGPLFRQKGVATRILAWDHNWDEPEEPLGELASPLSSPFLAGTAWHCYKGSVTVQRIVQEVHPERDTFLTECSGGLWVPLWRDALPWLAGSVLIGGTRGGARGVLLWNLALDPEHGPHTGGCTDCTGVVTVDPASGAVTRNLEYYVLAHASRFVRAGARRIESTTDVGELASVAFRNEDDGSIVLIVLNAGRDARRFSVGDAGANFAYELEESSLATFTWQPAALVQPSPAR